MWHTVYYTLYPYLLYAMRKPSTRVVLRADERLVSWGWRYCTTVRASMRQIVLDCIAMKWNGMWSTGTGMRGTFILLLFTQ